jgi:hypothetical protein
VESEVFVAAATGKPIFFILERPDSPIPNTAHRSYPVLLNARVKQDNYEPLISLIKFIGGDSRTLLEVFSRFDHSGRFLMWVMAPIMLILTLGVILGAIKFLTWIGFPEPWWHTANNLYEACKSYLAIAVALGYGGALAHIVMVRNKALRLARNMIRDGSFAYDRFHATLWDIESLKGSLQAMSSAPPVAHHELVRRKR